MNTEKPDLIRLEKALAYAFHDSAVIEMALTHRSYSGGNNERLEFLGDGLLNGTIAAELYKLQPGMSEGDLSRLRASLVRESTLAEIARELDLGDFLRLGPGEAGSQRRSSVLADALEAVLAAVYLDGGYSELEKVIRRLFTSRMENLPDPESLKDPKTRLQEYLQSRSWALPEYQVISANGPAHNRSFKVQCSIEGQTSLATGEGGSRRKAEQAAAAALLEQLQS